MILEHRSITVAINRQTKEVAEERLWDIMVHIPPFKNQLNMLGDYILMNYEWLRLGSDVPSFTLSPTWSYSEA